MKKSNYKDYISLDMLFKSVLVSALIYSTIIYLAAPNIINNISQPFHEMVKMIEINKQKIIMQSLLAESEMNRPELIEKYDTNSESEGKVYVYSKYGEESLNQNERNIMAILNIAKKYTPISFRNENVYLLYRSYESPTYLSTSEIVDFPDEIYNEMNSQERCDRIKICSKYTSEVQLSDRVLISPFYKDMLTGKTTVSIASPIYGEHGQVVYGDLNADFHLNGYFNNDFNLYSENQGEFRRNIIADKWINMQGLSYSTSFIADGNTTFIFKVAYSRIFMYNIWLLFLLFFLTYLVLYKWSEARRRRRELKLMHQDSLKDALTGLYNRKIFETDFFVERIHHTAGSLIAIDGNKIKFINDTYGHSVGDLAIQYIADHMKETFRTSDILIRMGGDEFVAVLPGCTHQNAAVLSKKLQERVQESVFSSHQINISVSCGVVYSEVGESVEEAIERADVDLYDHKKNRKDS